MPKAMNLSGQTYGKWYVVKYVGKNASGNSTYLCRCACGAEQVVQHGNLRGKRRTASGEVRPISQQCGTCAREEWSNKTVKHGLTVSGDPTYRAWVDAARVGRCPEWADFTAFVRDMGHRPERKVLQRTDTSQPHSKTNSYWGQRGHRIAAKYTIAGVTDTIPGWANRVGLSHQRMRQRIERTVGKHADCTLEQALLAPKGTNPAEYAVSFAPWGVSNG